MFEWLIVAKVLVSIFFVVGLSLVTEHASPRLAGILAGYPLGAAIALFFIGIENGKEFAAQGSVYTLGGLSASLVFVYFYYQVSQKKNRLEVFSSAMFAIAAFLVAAKLLSQFNLNLFKGFGITLGCICFFSYQFRNIPNVLVRQKVRFTPIVLVARALAAALIILIVTGIAKTVGPNWSGILSAFPITLFPLLLLIHVTYGREQVHTIIKNFPLGLGALMVYVVSVNFFYPVWGVGIGTVMSFVAATLYLIGFSFFFNWKRKKQAKVG
jgi:hypothetical protein